MLAGQVSLLVMENPITFEHGSVTVFCHLLSIVITLAVAPLVSPCHILSPKSAHIYDSWDMVCLCLLLCGQICIFVRVRTCLFA